MERQCPVCYDYIEYNDGVAYCFLCDEVYVDSDQEDANDFLVEIDDLPF